MTTLLAFLLVVAIIGYILYQYPDLRLKLSLFLRRRQGHLRWVLGLGQPRDIQRQAIALIKEQVQISVRNEAYLPTDVEVLINPDDFKKLGDIEQRVARQIEDSIAELDGKLIGDGARYKVIARPIVNIKPSSRVERRDVEVDCLIQEGTLHQTMVRNPDKDRAAPEVDTPVRQPEDPEALEAREGDEIRYVSLEIRADGIDPKVEEVELPIILGREESGDISIEHDSVSRPHCQIEWKKDSGFLITDLGSLNGVKFVQTGSDHRIQPNEPVPFHPEQTVRLSKYVTVRLIP